jgi:glycosyltransferase involved in cell wall biosynthesis
MSDDPRVSIIVPTRNRRALLAQTLRSILAQTYSNWEAIIVDDRSSDGTDELMAQMCAVDNRLFYVVRASNNPGANTCRNEGFAASRGEFLIFLDSDDFLAADCLRNRVREMKRHADLDFGVFPCEAFRETPGDERVLYNVPTDEPDLDKMLRLDIAWQTTSPMWTRKALKIIGPWDEKLPSWQDWEFHIRALTHGLRYKYFNTPPDCYWRMMNPVKESIGARAFTREHLVQREELLLDIERLLIKADLLTEQRKRYLAGLYFYHGMKCVEVDHKLASHAWHRCWRRGLINSVEYAGGMSFFRCWPWGRTHQWHRDYVLKYWPRELLGTISKTHLRACYNPLSEELPGEAEPVQSATAASARAAG